MDGKNANGSRLGMFTPRINSQLETRLSEDGKELMKFLLNELMRYHQDGSGSINNKVALQ